MGILSGYSFYLIGKLCALTSSKSLSECWGKTVGPSSSWVVALACVLTPLGAALSYSIILADVFSTLATSFGLTSSKALRSLQALLPRAAGELSLRTGTLLTLTSLVLYPLCTLKDLSSLTPVSLLGVLGILLTTAFMFLRLASGAYSPPSGAFFSRVAPSLRPAFPAKIAIAKAFNFDRRMLALLSMSATAYLSHFNAPAFLTDLVPGSCGSKAKSKDKEEALTKFRKLVVLSFSAVFLISAAIMSLGYLTFGTASSSSILNNYSARDAGATLCRLLMGVSVLGSYPLVFAGVRSSLLDLFKVEGASDSKKNALTAALLAAVTLAAANMRDVGIVVELNGAVLGSAIIYIFPSLMLLKYAAMQDAKKAVKGKEKAVGEGEKMANRALIAFGVLMAVVGGGTTIAEAMKK